MFDLPLDYHDAFYLLALFGSVKKACARVVSRTGLFDGWLVRVGWRVWKARTLDRARGGRQDVRTGKSYRELGSLEDSFINVEVVSFPVKAFYMPV